MRHQNREERARRQSDSIIAPGADPVEPRDPYAVAVPRRPSRALLFVIPALIIVLLGLGWMFLAEGDANDQRSPTAVEGTTGDEDELERPSDEREQTPEKPAP